MKDSILIAPSLLAADFCNLQSAVQSIEYTGGADILHLDIMDGHYVPNLTFGAPVISQLRQHTDLLFEAHLMINNPEDCVGQYIQAGCNRIIIHPETCVHLYKLAEDIQNNNCQFGLALNPAQSIESLNLPDIGHLCDVITVMSVSPGFGGQKFINSVLPKITKLKNYIQELNLNIQIEVDGGVNTNNIEDLVKAGTDILVAGSSIYNQKNTPDKNIQEFRQIIAKTVQ